VLFKREDYRQVSEKARVNKFIHEIKAKKVPDVAKRVIV
jgi:hypothetical protein